jgi:poly[ADP-ribose] polymerase 16
MNERVPERYFLVKNNDLVRVKYVLVYAEGKAEDRCVHFASPS